MAKEERNSHWVGAVSELKEWQQIKDILIQNKQVRESEQPTIRSAYYIKDLRNGMGSPE